ncbi:MAG: DsrE family protein [Syntrophales bacterium]|jgi:hypothetical protein|nr:DsrE family protein [Syntrophales bacterium]
MATKMFALITSDNREVALEAGLVYPLNAAKRKWLDEVKVIFFGPSEKLAAYDYEVQKMIKDIQDVGVEVLACRWCAERMNIVAPLEAAGLNVVYVGSVISDLIKDDWAQLTF